MKKKSGKSWDQTGLMREALLQCLRNKLLKVHASKKKNHDGNIGKICQHSTLLELLKLAKDLQQLEEHSFGKTGLISAVTVTGPGKFIFQCHILLPFHTIHRVLKARRLKWFSIPFCSGPHFVRTLHHDLSILGGPSRHGS